MKNTLAVRADCNEVMDPSLMGKKDCIRKKGDPTHRQICPLHFQNEGVSAFADNCTSILESYFCQIQKQFRKHLIVIFISSERISIHIKMCANSFRTSLI